MKKILILALCFCTFFLISAYGDREMDTAYTESNLESENQNAENASNAQDIADTSGTEDTKEADTTIQDIVKLGLTINDTYHAIPGTLRQFLDDGWSISESLPPDPYQYYETRASLSLTPDGKGVVPGGSIIRLLEKDGVFIEVTIANKPDIREFEKWKNQEEGIQKIEDCIVDSIAVSYDKAEYDTGITSIKLNGSELKNLKDESLYAAYPADLWEHVPTNLSDHPEFGISLDHQISRPLDNNYKGSNYAYNRDIHVYFDLQGIANKVSILNETPLKYYAK